MKLDYYTAIVSERELEILGLHLNSLRHYCPGIFNITISSPFPLGIDGVEELIVPIYEQPSLFFLNQAGYDFCNRIHQMIASGTADWFVVAHADIIYRNTLIETVSSYFREDVGLIGCWAHGLTIINRKVYNQCHLGFWPLPNIFLKEDTNLGGFYEEGRKQLVPSLDIGDALRIEIQSYGYKYERMLNLVGSVYHHVGALSGHAEKTLLKEDEKKSHLEELEKKKIKAISMFSNFK